jgi:hypothetical protein
LTAELFSEQDPAAARSSAYPGIRAAIDADGDDFETS